jgi:lysophospholipid acyltransferase (LPLAT)-like uncharacterized protein
MKRVLQHPAVQAALARLLGGYLRFALATTRWRVEGEAHLAPAAAGQPRVIAFWHERLPLMPALLLHARRQTPGLRAQILASRHRDGRFLGEIMRRFGVAVAHGSSARDGHRDKGGAQGARSLLQGLAEGMHAVITPDGPRGPRRVAAPGVAQLAGRAGVPVLPCGGQVRRHIALPTWDRMVLPLPFGRGVLLCGPEIAVPAEEWAASLPAITAALSAAADRADALCR